MQSAEHGRVTHRVVAISSAENGHARLTLQGDTNATPDAETYVVRTADRVAFGVPGAGYVLSAASTPAGLLLGGLLVVGAVVLGFRPQGPRRGAHAVAGSGRRHAAVAVGAVSALTIGGAIGVSGLAPFSPTGALWTDSATANATITATGGDTTPPVLTNPLPADGTSGATWLAIDCADAGAGVAQICVSATDTGGSGVSTVTVKAGPHQWHDPVLERHELRRRYRLLAIDGRAERQPVPHQRPDRRGDDAGRATPRRSPRRTSPATSRR
ncbi:hypothetical protein G5V59_02915 [Nocardioides sp. W3-2-3]|uniref:hypothetical protein n=1 Tax=Nocardioides convexus TaxID=2712224 RepID=UPI002418985C|nr:hypothetical protein [Nocardioides convexus]NGZ99691.1 hypothetical protein [Nocardioides convexus]